MRWPFEFSAAESWSILQKDLKLTTPALLDLFCHRLDQSLSNKCSCCSWYYVLFGFIFLLNFVGDDNNWWTQMWREGKAYGETQQCLCALFWHHTSDARARRLGCLLFLFLFHFYERNHSLDSTPLNFLAISKESGRLQSSVLWKQTWLRINTPRYRMFPYKSQKTGVKCGHTPVLCYIES